MAHATEPILRFDGVTRHRRDGDREIAVLDNVSFQMREGDFMGLFGTRRTGKSTLLRLAAGIELADEGTVSYRGRDLAAMGSVERERLPIAFVSAEEWRAKPGELVSDHVALALAGRASSAAEARRATRQALRRVGLLGRAHAPASSLSLGERTRALLARTLVCAPRLMLVDEPALIPGLAEREAVGGLLRAIAHELDATLIVASEELTALHSTSVLMSIAGGEVCSTEPSRPLHEPLDTMPQPDRGDTAVVIRLPTRRAPAREHFPL